jgi:MoaA/NifB/PqqE/SkfB family radical SAM enzyme
MKVKQPVFLFELTQRCEFNCNPCYENILVAHQHEEMRLWEWLIIIESIAAQEGKLIIAGGDPFLREDLFDILSYATVIGVDVEIATCGLNLTPERLEALKKNGVESIIIRMDGITREENDTYRGVRSYDNALDAIQLIQDFAMKASLVINSDVDQKKLEVAYEFSRAYNIPLFIATKSWRGAPSLIRSRSLEKLTESAIQDVHGAIINPEGKIYRLRDAGVQFSGDVQSARYRLPASET